MRSKKLLNLILPLLGACGSGSGKYSASMTFDVTNDTDYVAAVTYDGGDCYLNDRSRAMTTVAPQATAKFDDDFHCYDDGDSEDLPEAKVSLDLGTQDVENSLDLGPYIGGITAGQAFQLALEAEAGATPDVQDGTTEGATIRFPFKTPRSVTLNAGVAILQGANVTEVAFFGVKTAVLIPGVPVPDGSFVRGEFSFLAMHRQEFHKFASYSVSQKTKAVLCHDKTCGAQGAAK